MLRAKGMLCAPNQTHSAARIGSDVFPVMLPAVAQAINDKNAIGSSTSATLRRTCDNETHRTR